MYFLVTDIKKIKIIPRDSCNSLQSVYEHTAAHWTEGMNRAMRTILRVRTLPSDFRPQNDATQFTAACRQMMNIRASSEEKPVIKCLLTV